MADNADVNSGTGITVATDKIGGVDYQRVKVVWGADGTATDTEAAAPMPVVQTGTLNVGTVTTVTAVTALTNALPAGANAIGKLAANSGVDIGDVDVTTVPADPFGVNADAASATGSISAKLRFIANTGIPVTGTVTVGSHAVTNAGTFLVQENGSWVQVDDAAFSPAVSKIAMVGAEFDDAAPDSVDEGDGGALRMSANRNLYSTIRDAAGNERGVNVNASNQLAVAGPVTVVSGGIAAGAIATGATSIAENEDVASASADTGVKMLVIQRATPADTAADLDYSFPQMSAGRVWTSTNLPSGAVASGAFASGALASGSIAVGAIAAGATSIADNEDVGSADGDRGVKVLAVRKNTAASTSGSDGDYQFLITNTTGHLWVDASGQTLTVGTHAVTVASGGIASGAVASGAVASGAFASGAIGSGAVASGAVASGAFASGALASGSIAAGAIARGATSIADDEDVTSGAGDTGVKTLVVQQSTPADTAGNGDYCFPQMSGGMLWTWSMPKQVTITQTITRPANTTTYAINDALADTAATAGGDTVTSIARVSGGSGTITDVVVVFDEDAAVPLQGEILLFDSAFTTTADNSAFALSDGDAKLFVAKIPFALEDMSNNGGCHIQNLNIGFTCVGTANLRSIIRVKNAYVPTTNSSVLTIRYKVIQA